MSIVLDTNRLTSDLDYKTLELNVTRYDFEC